MVSPAFVRLSASSAELARQIDESDPGPYEPEITLTCAQVPQQFGPGSPIWLWLGSDNNKGVATDWAQGIRAIGKCRTSDRIEGTKEFQIVLEDLYVLPRSVSKMELLQASPETYAQKLAEAAIIGIYNYSSQVVQILTDEQFSTIGAVIAHMMPEVRIDLFNLVPSSAGIELISRPEENDPEGVLPDNLEVEEEIPRAESSLDDNDQILQVVRHLIEDDGWGGVILLGAPGTGKSWYAREIAIKLTEGDRRRMREVQFHPSYQYEDFVEGYVPKGSTGFVLKDKHLLQMASIARSTDNPVVLVIDEFSRTDPARVMGEAMTYMEGSQRGREFSLPSGRTTDIPKNLIFLATMNPEDRSVDEIDAAMERRWAKVELLPDVNKLRNFLDANQVNGPIRGSIINFFSQIQNYLPIGHAFFRTVRDAASLERLWERQLQYVIKKRFRYDPHTQEEISNLWLACMAAANPPPAELNPNDQVLPEVLDT